MSAFSAEDLRMITKGARYERKVRKKSALSSAYDHFIEIINSDDFKNKVMNAADNGRDTVSIFNWNFVDNVKFGDTFLTKLLMNGLLDDLNGFINPDNSPDGIYIGFVDNRNAKKPLSRVHDYTLFYSWRVRNTKPTRTAKPTKPTVVDAADETSATEVTETPAPAPVPAPAPEPEPEPTPQSVEPVVLPEVSTDTPNDVKEKKVKKAKKVAKGAKKADNETTEQTPAPVPAEPEPETDSTTAAAPAPAPASAFKPAPKMDWYKSDTKSAPTRGRGRGWPVASGRGAPPSKSIPMSDAPPRRVGDD